MTITLPPNIQLPQEGGLSKFLGGLGTGIGKGAEKAGALTLQQMLTNQNSQIKEKARLTQNADKNLKTWLGSTWEGLDTKDKVKLTTDYKKKIGEGATNEEAVLDIVKMLTEESPKKETFKETMEKQHEKTGKLTDLLPARVKRNLRNSATAILTGQGLSLEEIRKMEQEDPNFLTKAADMLQSYGIDIPVMGAMGVPGAIAGAEGGGLAGGAIGSAFGGIRAVPGAAGGALIGGAAGGGAAALGGRTAIMSSYRQWLEHKEQGGPLTFDEFRGRAESVAKDFNKSALIGAFAGAGGTGGGVSGEMAGLALGESLAEGKPPSPEEMALNAILMGTMKGAKKVSGKLMPKGYKGLEKIQNEIKNTAKKTGLSVEEVSNEVFNRNPDLKAESVYQGNSKDINKILKSVKDITNDLSPEAKKVAKSEKKTVDTGKKALEKQEVSRKEYGEAIGREPVEEYVSKPKLTKKEKALFKEKATTESKVKGLEKEITRYQKEVNKLKEYEGKQRTKQRVKNQELLEGLIEHRKFSKENFEHRLNEIGKEIKEAAPKPGKKMTAEEKKFYLDKHMKELKEMSDDPKGKVAENWNRMFERDQKYQKQNEANMKRGKIPGAEYVGENIRILDRYLNEYQALEKLTNKRLKTAKGKEKAMLKRLQKNIDTNTKINRNKRAVWERYRSVKEAVRKPFIAKMLKDMGHNLGRHERVIFEAKEVLGKTDVKAKDAWKKFEKNPSSENLREAAEKSGMDGEKTEQAAKDFEESIKEDNTKKSEERAKEGMDNLDDSMEGTPKEKAEKIRLTIPTIVSAALKKLGIKLSPDAIRNLMLVGGASSFTTMRGVIRVAKRKYNVAILKDMKRRKDYKGLSARHQKYMKGGGAQATWNKWLKEAG